MKSFLGRESYEAHEQAPSDVHPARLHSAWCPETKLVRRQLIVRRPDGNTVQWHPTEPIPPGFEIVAGDDEGTVPAEQAEIDRHAVELNAGMTRTGRRVLIPDEGARDEIRDDTRILADHNLRGTIDATIADELAKVTR